MGKCWISTDSAPQVATWLIAVLVMAVLDNLSSNTTYQVLATLLPLLLAIPITEPFRVTVRRCM
jgi:hypothetical protein